MTLYSYNRKYKTFSRALRRKQTDAEAKLWFYLRGRQLHGFKFRRQHPIDKYILDFFCEERKLAIELDGSQHLEKEYVQKDNIRQDMLSVLGIKTVRFPDTDIFNNINGVITKIEENLL